MGEAEEDDKQFDLIVESSGLDHEQVDSLKKGFDGFDKEGGGTITQTTMQMILKSMGVKVDKDEMDGYAAEVDEEASGKFTFLQFCESDDQATLVGDDPEKRGQTPSQTPSQLSAFTLQEKYEALKQIPLQDVKQRTSHTNSNTASPLGRNANTPNPSTTCFLVSLVITTILSLQSQWLATTDAMSSACSATLGADSKTTIINYQADNLSMSPRIVTRSLFD